MGGGDDKMGYPIKEMTHLSDSPCEFMELKFVVITAFQDSFADHSWRNGI